MDQIWQRQFPRKLTFLKQVNGKLGIAITGKRQINHHLITLNRSRPLQAPWPEAIAEEFLYQQSSQTNPAMPTVWMDQVMPFENSLLYFHFCFWDKLSLCRPEVVRNRPVNVRYRVTRLLNDHIVGRNRNKLVNCLFGCRNGHCLSQ